MTAQNRTIRRSQPLIVFLSSTLIVFLIYLIIQYPYLVSDYIFGLDDNIYVPQALFGQVTIPNIHQLPYLFFALVGPLGSIALIKLLILLMLSACAGLIALLLSRYINAPLAVLLGLAVLSFPIDVNQVVFVTGAHPLFCLFFVLCAVLVFDWSTRLSGRQFVFANILTVLLLLTALAASPVGRIIPLAYPLWVFIAWLNARKNAAYSRQWGLAFGVPVIIGIIGYFAIGMTGHHYSDRAGWIDISSGRIFENLGMAVQLISLSMLSTRLRTVYTILVTGFILLTVIYAWRKHRAEITSFKVDTRKLIVLGINMLIVSALAFAPTSVVIEFRARYVLLPWVTLLLSISAITLGLIPSLHTHYRLVLMTWLIALMGGNFFQFQRNTQSFLANSLKSHETFVHFARQERPQWSANAQIILLTGDPYIPTTAGYNHWSSWYLRFLADNPQVIGLIGTADMIMDTPFITQYSDHGDMFWKVIDGTSKRISMIGLEYNRPTFVYETYEGEFQAIDYLLISDDTGTHYIPYGHSYQQSQENDLQTICQENSSALFFVWNDHLSRRLCEP